MQKERNNKRNQFFLFVGILLALAFIIMPQAKVYAYRSTYPGEFSRRYGVVAVKKVDENGDLLEGATFSVKVERYDRSGALFVDDASGMPATINTSEFYLSNEYLDDPSFTNVFDYEKENIARITLTETDAPDGYAQLTNPIVLEYYYEASTVGELPTIYPIPEGQSTPHNSAPDYYAWCRVVDDGGADVEVNVETWAYYQAGPMLSVVTIKNVPQESNAKTTLNKYLVIDEDAEIPNVTYSYSISAPQTKIEPTDETMVVYPGVTPNLVKINGAAQTGVVTFTAGDATTPGALDGVATATEKYARKDIQVDFSACTYTEPGVYRYYLTEANKTDPFDNDDVPVRTIDVYVEAQGNELVVAGFVSYQGEVTTAPKYDVDMSDYLTDHPKPVEADYDADSSGLPLEQTEQDAYNAAVEAWQTAYNAEHEARVAEVPNGVEASLPKSDKYVNKYLTQNLIVSKTVKGNQGSRDQYFAIKVTLNGLMKGTILNIDQTDSNFEISTLENEATSHAKATMDAANGVDNVQDKAGQQLVANDSGSFEHTFYLHHGQYIQINGLPKTATYTIEEIDPAAGYTKSYENQSGTIVDADIEGKVINTRGGVIPTGLITTVLPGTVLVGGAAFYFLTKKKEEEEE